MKPQQNLAGAPAAGKVRKLQIVGIIAAAVILAGMFLVPTSEALPYEARNTLGVLLAVVILLITEAFPLGIVCLSAISMLYFFGCVKTVPEALSGFTNATLFFLLASFGISEALTAVPVSTRLLLVLMKKFGRNINQMLFAVMLVTAAISSVISNVAAAAMFIPLVNNFMCIYDDEESRRRSRRAFMIALPVASMIGGMVTPAGSSISILTISMLEKYTGTTIPFVHWMLMGAPLAIIMLPVAWFFCARVLKPAPLTEKQIADYAKELKTQIPAKMTKKEIYVLSVVLVLLVLWILSSWVPFLQVAAVSLAGLLLLFLPGKAAVLTWKDFTRSVSLPAFLLMGTMISIGNIVTSSGLGAWISQVIFPSGFVSVTPLVIAFVALMTFVLLIPIPVSAALITMLAGPLIAFCESVGVSPVLIMAAFGLCASNCYLLPLDTVPLMTFSTGAYGMFDMPKATVWIQIVMIIVSSLWLSVVGLILGC